LESIFKGESMGLINKNNYYIRLTLDGSYYVYPTKDQREIEKAIPTYEEVIQKYSEIIQGLSLDKEALYYLGNACELAGDTEKAVDCYRKIVASMANYRDVPQRLERLAPAADGGAPDEQAQ
jgi:tetratricopeptide (TPR) repeat protein